MKAAQPKDASITVTLAVSLSSIIGENILPTNIPMKVEHSKNPSCPSLSPTNLALRSLFYSAIGNIPMSMLTKECAMHKMMKK